MELAIVRLKAPFVQRDGAFKQIFHGGRLQLPEDELERLLAICRRIPTTVDIYLDRPHSGERRAGDRG